jgi:hypothetical protein
MPLPVNNKRFQSFAQDGHHQPGSAALFHRRFSTRYQKENTVTQSRRLIVAGSGRHGRMVKRSLSSWPDSFGGRGVV